LDGDAVDALARDLRLRHGELRTVQPVAQDDDVLLHGVVLAVLDLLRCQHQRERRRAVDRHLAEIQVAVVGEDCRLALGAAVVVAEQDPHAVSRVVHLDILIGNARAPERGTEVLFAVIELLLHRARHVHLVDQVHAAPQIEAELQGAQAQVPHPIRHARGLRQCNREDVRTRLRDDVARLQLILLGGEAQRQAALIHEGAGRGHALRFEQRRDVGPVARLHGRTVARQLQRALFAEQIR
jgi:hypothetical protein